MKRQHSLRILFSLAMLLGANLPTGMAAEEDPVDLFDAMQSGTVEAKFIAMNSHEGRIILTNKADEPVSVQIPESFIGVPMAQFGGGGFGGGGLGGGGLGGGGFGGGQQNVGGGGGFGGGGRGGRGGRGNAFNVAPERVTRVDVPLLCLDHGLREPSSNKPYAIRPIENYIKDPATIAIVAAYANGDLPPGAAQAAVWNLNSGTSWNELAAKLTGTVRNINRSPYFSRDEIQAAMAIVNQARVDTVGIEVKARKFELPEDRSPGESEESASPGEDEETSPGEVEEAPVEESEQDESAAPAFPAEQVAGDEAAA